MLMIQWSNMDSRWLVVVLGKSSAYHSDEVSRKESPSLEKKNTKYIWT